MSLGDFQIRVWSAREQVLLRLRHCKQDLPSRSAVHLRLLTRHCRQDFDTFIDVANEEDFKILLLSEFCSYPMFRLPGLG